MTATLDYDSFAKELNTTFQIQVNQEQTVAAELVDLSEHLVSKVQDQFSIVFRTSNEVFLGQGQRELHHERMGDFSLFLVPIGRDEQGTSYEAVFNRLIKKN
jgi:Domain of unknown function (DUF6916)